MQLPIRQLQLYVGVKSRLWKHQHLWQYIAFSKSFSTGHRKISERYGRENPHKYLLYKMQIWCFFKLPGRETWKLSAPYPATWESCLCHWPAPDALKEGCTWDIHLKCGERLQSKTVTGSEKNIRTVTGHTVAYFFTHPPSPQPPLQMLAVGFRPYW